MVLNHLSGNLGRVVSEIVHEFCVRPPQRMTVAAPSAATASYQPPSTSSMPLGITSHHAHTQPRRGASAGEPPTYATGGRAGDVTNTATAAAAAAAASGSSKAAARKKTWSMPPASRTFVEVQPLVASDIQTLIDEDETFQTFCGTVSNVQNLNTVLSMLRNKNGKCAVKNLSYEEELTTLRTETESLHAILKEKKISYDALIERRRLILNKSSPIELIRKLKQKAEEISDASEELADEFVRDEYEGNQKEWLKEFLVARSLYHRRKAMILRYEETVRR